MTELNLSLSITAALLGGVFVELFGIVVMLNRIAEALEKRYD